MGGEERKGGREGGSKKGEREERRAWKVANIKVAVVYSILTFKASPEEEFQTISLMNVI